MPAIGLYPETLSLCALKQDQPPQVEWWARGRVPSPLERHQAWQVRKVGKSSMCSQRGSRSCCPLVETPSPPPGTDAEEKLYVCVKEAHTRHTAFCGSQSQTSSHCSKWDSSGAVRGTVAEGGVSEPRAPLLHPVGHGAQGTGSLSDLRKKYT